MRPKSTILALALLAWGCGGSGNPTWSGGNSNAPVAQADRFNVLGGGLLSASLTANDLTNGAVVSSFQNPSAAGGAVVISAAGLLNYTPPANAANLVDSFSYTLSNAAGSSTATVTVTIGARGFFVKNDAPAGGTGSQASPFRTLAQAQAAASGVSGAEIVLFAGDGTSTGQAGAVVLSANQVLRALDPAQPPLLTGPITLASNTTLASLRVNGGGGVSASGSSDLTIRDCTVSNTTGDGLALSNVSGQVSLSGNQFLSNGARGLAVQTSGGNFSLSNNTMSNTNSDGLALSNVTGHLSLSGNQFLNNGARGLAVQSSGGSVNLSLSNNTVSRSGREGILANVTNTANVTWSEVGSRISQAGTNPFGNSWNLFARQTAVLNVSMTSCLSEQASRFGLEAQSFDASNLTLVFDQGVVRDGGGQGIALGALGNSTFKARVSNTQTQQNLPGFGFEAGNDQFALMCLRLVGVQSDVYRLGNNSPAATFNIENFANFGTENTGILNPTGTINSVPVGSCGIP